MQSNEGVRYVGRDKGGGTGPAPQIIQFASWMRADAARIRHTPNETSV